MRFVRISLVNFKCYADATVSLDEGVTVVHGVNGSGKSSLLEACFFALYGARSFDRTLDDVVRVGAEEATVELEFVHDGRRYRIERRIRATGATAQTATCILETPDDTIEGARDVRARITELLRMDAEAFTNCAYVRQGEVNRLINATPTQRQAMIDALLQLGTLEEYRERAGQGRLAVEDVRADRRGRLAELADQIEAKEAKEPHDRLNAIQSELNEVESEIERFEANRDEARKTLENAESVLADHEERREELAELEATIEELQAAIAESTKERETLADRLEDTRERVAALESERDERLAEMDLEAAAGRDHLEAVLEDRRAAREAIGEEIQSHIEAREQATGEADALADQAQELDARVESKREDAAALEDEIEAAEAKLADRRERLAALEDEIEAAMGAFDDAPVVCGEAESHLASVREKRDDHREALADLRATLETARERVAQAEALLEAGNCPECGQPVEGAPHVDSIAEDRERVAELEREIEAAEERDSTLATRVERAESLVETEATVRDLRSKREHLESLLADRAEVLVEKRERVDRLRTEATELETEAAEKREAAAEKREAAEATREAIAECNSRRADLKAEIEALEALRSVWTDLAEAREVVDDIESERDRLAELADERRERLAEKRERRAEIEAQFDDESVAAAREDKARAESYLEEVATELEALDQRRDELQSQVGGIEAELEELETLRDKHDRLEARVAALDELYEDVDRLESMYGDLRTELRQRNVETLERMLNETFDLVYQNDSYARIELDGSYELTVYQKNGEPLAPAQLSGGERALFNLSLRCAIYRLLAEGIDGTAPMPPLILDEPTVFLDAGHVSKLVDLVESMRALGVAQIIVVSHDEELVGAADHLVRVRKDPTSNRSTVERASAAAGTPELAADD